MTQASRLTENQSQMLPPSWLALSRRQMLQLMGAFCLTPSLNLSLSSCSRENPEPPPFRLTDPTSLAQLREMIRTSPDHLQARAEEVVATKDVKRIVDFVRENIAVLPPFRVREEGAYVSRWGIEGTLRSGAGTLKDRADLMAAMLAAAGIPAQVREIPAPARLSASQLYQAHPHEFSINKTTIKDLLEAIQADSQTQSGNARSQQSDPQAVPATPPHSGVIDDHDVTSLVNATMKDLTAALRGAMTDLQKEEFPVPTRIPAVTIDGDRSSVLVALGSHSIETSYGDTNKLPIISAYPSPEITFSVTAYLSPRPGGGRPRVVELVKGAWPVKDVVGHQVQILFAPPQGGQALLSAPLTTFSSRVPVIRVQPRPSGKLDSRQFIFEKLAPPTSTPSRDQKPLSGIVAGSVFTVSGEVLAEASKGNPTKQPTLVVLDDGKIQIETQRIARLEASVNATSFPEIEVSLSATDAQGAPVDGLGLSAFTVTEGSYPCLPTLVANRQPERNPRVLILYDGSGSVTESFGSPEQFSAFNRALAQTLVDAASVQPFDVQVVGLGSGSNERNWVTPTVDELTKNMGHFTWSTLWTSFSHGALDDGPAAIIAVSDFDVTDVAEAPAAKARLARSNVPVIAITTGKVNENLLTEFLAATQGTRFAATDSNLKSALAGMVVTAAKRQNAYSYRFQYKTQIDGPHQRQIQLALANRSSIYTTATYSVPSAEKHYPPASVAGLYLTISVGDKIDRRHLGGIRFSEGGSTEQDPYDQALIDEARNALNGLVTVTVEPGNPTLGAVLEDAVVSCQSIAPLVEKSWAPNELQAFTAAAKGVYRYPLNLAKLLGPPPLSEGVTGVVPQGLRIVISTEHPKASGWISRIDLPPALNQIRVAEAVTAQMPTVLRASLWLSANESLIYADSAFKRLQGRPLKRMSRYEGGLPEVVVKQAGPEKAALFRRLADRYYEFIRLVPVDGGSVAMWVVDPASGSVMAVDDTERGGTGHDHASSDMETFFTILKILGVSLFVASAVCELTASPAQEYICMGIATKSVLLTATTTMLEWEGMDFHDPFVVGNLIGEGVFTGFDVASIVKALQNNIATEHVAEGRPTVKVVLLCISYAILQLVMRVAQHK